ncbi:hypothetical protein [Litchfieldia salsa]|uniref:Uncharacterized protein n=1 Tax=Litchfieldia salsa TaxID=930152 RepID=A0A1H0VQB2_9BACI|nr:hypothetical protein [Litchfieldia salsa]SDP80772.1 hypothetical protein SAMN05216565_107152 [Litchfieldia salsa]
MNKLFALFYIVIMVLVGCNSDDNFVTYNDQKVSLHGRISTLETNRRSGEFTNVVTDDGIPNLVSITDSNHYKSDVRKAHEVISMFDQYKTNNVRLNGNHIEVIVYQEEKSTPRQQIEAEESLRSQLLAALPRYTIEVSIKEY